VNIFPRWCPLLALPLCIGCGAAPTAESDEHNLIEAWSPEPVRDGNLRVATFNIRNFPNPGLLDGDPDNDGDTPAPLSYQLETDREALLAVLERLSFDVLAVQEILDVEELGLVLEELGLRTGRSFAWAFSDNALGNPQHIGFVVDADKLLLEDVREHEEVDTRGTLRPGFSARITSTREGGVDFSAMVLHLASGSSGGRAELRAEQAAQAALVVAGQQAERADDDYLVLGDLNTARGDDELPLLDQSFAEGTGLAREANETGCTSYWIKKSTNPLLRPSWLDHVYGASLAERDAEVPLVSGAHCVERRCEPYESTDAESGGSFYGVSDHCPVYFELRDVDDDPS
jgi:endonuclease/exonuclease/phosphatase family metal-dependent hydrolase